ncbi:MAG: porin [Rugosibacter sp.]|jgi:predicted porin|nr:porin [Rugosibacter sp.]MDO9272298.1 porin [Rugosibacter sp.]
MQKKLIALAITGLLSGAAFAQSNVTVYGLAYGSYDFIDASGPNAARGAPSYSRVTSNASRLGFKGTEKLGNGLDAIFQFESQVDLDQSTGTTGLFGTARDSFVGLKGEFGTVKLGFFSGPNRAFLAKLDTVAYSEGVGDNTAIVGKLGGRGSFFDSRYANSIAYISPKFSGFEATVQYQANEEKDESTGAKLNPSTIELGLIYNNGPIYAGLTHGQRKLKNDLSADANNSAGFRMGSNMEATETRIGGVYNLGDATLHALYARTDAEGSLGDLKQNVWALGATYKVTPTGKIVGQYYSAADISGNLVGQPNLSDTGAKFWVLGYEHSLSKRTMLTAHYAYLKNDDRTGTVAGNASTRGYDFGNGRTGITGNGTKLTGLTFGIAHAF